MPCLLKETAVVMPSDPTRNNAEQTRIFLGVLQAAEHNGGVSQRRLASELRIAVGLTNAYVKRCVKKGLLKVKQVPARRYAYYLTPEGFAEKSRLTAEYLSSSFNMFRQWRADCAAVFTEGSRRGWKRVAVYGVSDVAEIAAICAAEAGVEIVAVVDPGTDLAEFLGRPIVRELGALAGKVDGIIVTAIADHSKAHADAVAVFGVARVLVPRLLAQPHARGPDTAAEKAPQDV